MAPCFMRRIGSTVFALAIFVHGSHSIASQDPVVIDFTDKLLEVQPYAKGATKPSDDVFMAGDMFKLNGTVHSSGGSVSAKRVGGSGQSPDHVIVFKAFRPCTQDCEFRLTILLDGGKPYCEGDTESVEDFIELNYAKNGIEYATLSEYKPPLYCGDALPKFKSSLFTLRTYPGPSNFGNGDVFLLDGHVDNSSGHVTAKLVSGKGLDHQLIFGNSSCERNMFSMTGIKKRWPLTIVVNGNKTAGFGTYAEFRPTDGFVIMQYGDENAQLDGQGPHYERPSGGMPCLPDESFARVAGTGGAICAPPCSGGKVCSADTAKGVTATPTCGALFDPSGNKYCGLRCQRKDECGHDPTAQFAFVQASGPGLCVFGSAPQPPRDSIDSFSTFSVLNVMV